MEYGAKYILWAPFAAENAEEDHKLPKYGPAVWAWAPSTR